MAASSRFSVPRRGIGWLWRWEGAVAGGFLFRGSQILAIAAGASIVLLVLVNFVTVVGRKSPWAGAWLTGGVEVSELFMAMVSVLAIAYCWYQGGHIRIGLLRDRLSPRKRAGLDAVSALFFLIWVAAIAWGNWGQGMRYLAVSQAGWFTGIPIAPFAIVFCLAMAHFGLVLLRSGLGAAAKARGRHVEHEGLY